jgi:hypothetical protein
LFEQVIGEWNFRPAFKADLFARSPEADFQVGTPDAQSADCPPHPICDFYVAKALSDKLADHFRIWFIFSHDNPRPTKLMIISARAGGCCPGAQLCNFDCCLKRLDRLGLVISSQSFVCGALGVAGLVARRRRRKKASRTG